MIKVEDVDGNDIKLPYGTIELDVEQEHHRVKITWEVEYHRSDLDLYRYEWFYSLEEALDWYNKQDLATKDL